MSVHRLFRNTHLMLGLFSCPWLLMYGLSSVQMAHNRWFRLQPEVTVSRIRLAPGAAEARPVARELMDSYGVRGELSPGHASGGQIEFVVVRPGTVYQVSYAPVTGETSIRENRAGFMGMLNRLHHVGGVRHPYWLVNVWGAFTAIISAALIGIGMTGIYLWFKMHRERTVGVLILVLSLGYSLTLLVILRGLR